MTDIGVLESSDAREVCEIIESNGFSAYCVGGCVRDAIRGVSPHDFDITTSALPDEVIALFESHGCRVVETGILHGTVSVLFDDKEFEITTMRREGSYADNRHPDSVEFVQDIYLDLERRDFAMNAVAYSFSEKRIIDPFGGVKDIDEQVIKCVNDPHVRFDEDALRILRALRFASTLGYSIDEDTLIAMRAKKHSLLHLSPERIYSELVKLLCGDHAGKVVYDHYDILGVIVPQLIDCYKFDQCSKYHCFDVLKHICEVVDNIPNESHLRLAALFHDIGKPSCFSLDENNCGHFYGHAQISAEIAENILKKLKVDKITYDRVLFLVKSHDTPLPSEERLIKKRLSKIGEQYFFDLLSLATADCLGQSPSVHHRLSDYREISRAARDILDRSDCISVSSMNINGNDIISLGVQEGKTVGLVLSKLLEMIINEEIANEHEALINEAHNIINEINDIKLDSNGQ